MEKESIYITDGIENASLSLHYIRISGDSLSNVGLLNIDNTTSVNREKMYLVFLSMSAACVLCVFSSHSFWTSNSLDVVVVVFFTLTDRASTIPNNTRGCQSGTWSAGQKKIRGTSTKLQ